MQPTAQGSVHLQNVEVAAASPRAAVLASSVHSINAEVL